MENESNITSVPKTAIVTGANRGIGYAIFKSFLMQGFHTIAVVRNKEKFERVVEDTFSNHKDKVQIYQAEFSDEDSVQACGKEICKQNKRIDILVNNIGSMGDPSQFLMTKSKSIKGTFQINLFSPLLFTQVILHRMMRGGYGSRVVFISSSASFDAGNNIGYVASKCAINGAVKRLSLELANYNILVNGVAPGFTDTDMAANQGEEDKEKAFDRMAIKRMAKPEEIANAVSFLVSDQASFCTGQILRVDGGLQ